MNPSIVFVSGGSGFVGTAVIRELLSRGHRVHALIHRQPLKVEDARISVFRGELDDAGALYPAMERAAAAIHLVGIIREKPKRGVTFARMHVEFTRAVVAACQKHGVKRLIHMSALGARPDAVSAYHRTKAEAEKIVEGSSLAWTIIRPSLIHGEGGEFTQMVGDWARGRRAPWLFMPYFGAGALGTGRRALVQPVRVEDVARAFVEAIGRPQTVGRCYDLGGEQQLTWPAMYRAFARSQRGRPRATLAIPAWYALFLTRVVPAALLPFNGAQIAMSQEDSIADPQAFTRDFGFAPMGLEDALARGAQGA